MNAYLSLLAVAALFLSGCSGVVAPVAVSGVKEVVPVVPVGPDGRTSEQRNILERLKADNQPGAIKHLYVFSAYSGQCILYSTVKEKVTSSGKRLSPTTVATNTRSSDWDGIPVAIGGRQFRTGEVLQDDGTYGSSIDYLFWYDVRGVFHCHYPQGGQIIHISTEPMPVKSIVVNIEQK